MDRRNDINPKEEKLELIDIDNYFCLFSKNEIPSKSIPDSLYRYLLFKTKKGKIKIYNPDIPLNDNIDTFMGTVISKIPIYMDKGIRNVKELEFLGVYSSIQGFLYTK